MTDLGRFQPDRIRPKVYVRRNGKIGYDHSFSSENLIFASLRLALYGLAYVFFALTDSGRDRGHCTKLTMTVRHRRFPAPPSEREAERATYAIRHSSFARSPTEKAAFNMSASVMNSPITERSRSTLSTKLSSAGPW